MAHMAVETSIAGRAILARGIHFIPYANGLPVLNHKALSVVAFLLDFACLSWELLHY